MRDLIQHAESGLMLDFAEDDFGGPEQADLVRAWREGGHRTDKGVFICYRHREYERPWLYLQQRGGQLVAAHWPGSGVPDHEIIHGVSDEHRRQVEYLQRAGEAAGFEVRTEVTLPTHVRSDAVIYGPVNMGVEVQRSAITATAAKARTTKARRAGVESAWFTDSEKKPKWLYQVPTVGMNADVRWDAVPSSGSVTVVSGVRVIQVLLCRDIPSHRNECPNRRYRGCGGWHAIHHPCMGLRVDDVAAMFPAGELVPMRYRTFTSGDIALIVSAADKKRYEEVSGRSGDIPLKEPRPRMRQAGRVECATDLSIVGNLTFVAGRVHPDTGRCAAHSYWPHSSFVCAVPTCPGSTEKAS